jgi:hypothetical protein
MYSLNAIFLFLFIFSILILVRELLTIVFRMVQNIPKPKPYSDLNLFVIASSISYIITYIILI